MILMKEIEENILLNTYFISSYFLNLINLKASYLEFLEKDNSMSQLFIYTLILFFSI